MKKIYLIAGAALLSVAAFGQSSEEGKAYVKGTRTFSHVTSPERLLSPDTTGIVNYLDFLPEFLPNGGQASIYGYTGGGYLYGNNVSLNHFKAVAQGYDNLNSTPVNVVGVLMWFGGKESDNGSSATSKVVVSAYNMLPNKAYNTTGTGINTSTLNWEGPTGAAQSPTDLLFVDIDTLDFNYVQFNTPATFVDDFAVSMDVSTLATGDTVGLVSDRQNDAFNLDFAYHKVTSWYVSDMIFSGTAGTGGLDNNIAMWAVIEDATGVNEFFNGMKLTTYPNPSVDQVTVEYTLEKDSKNVKLMVFSTDGRKVLENNYSQQSEGTYKTSLNTSDFAAGNYFYQLSANGHMFTKKFVVTK